jgi:hypothetical protein
VPESAGITEPLLFVFRSVEVSEVMAKDVEVAFVEKRLLAVKAVDDA